jgi:hypothetical protein
MAESSSDMSSQRKKHSWLSPIGGGLLLPPLEREVDNGNYDEVAAGGTPAAIVTWAKAEAVDAAPEIFSDAGARTGIFLS